jgi:hypothetical protein
MVKKVLVTASALTLVASFAIVAAESGTSKGNYANHNTVVETVELPGGGSVQVLHFKQFTFAEDPGHPIHNSSQDCVGVSRVDADGGTVSFSGSCFGSDGEGNGFAWWWRQDEAGTESCPTACGSWGYFSGFGKYEGISGSGTWAGTAAYPDGGTGSWKGSYSVP